MATSCSDAARVFLILPHFSVALDGVAFAAFKRIVYELVIVLNVIFNHVPPLWRALWAAPWRWGGGLRWHYCYSDATTIIEMYGHMLTIVSTGKMPTSPVRPPAPCRGHSSVRSRRTRTRATCSCSTASVPSLRASIHRSRSSVAATLWVSMMDIFLSEYQY